MENISQMSLLEVAIILMEQKRAPQAIRSLIKEVFEMKGIEDNDSSLAAQLYIDITTSSKFVYMGNEEWDLKSRQSLDEYDKDGSAFNAKGADLEEEVVEPELDDLEDEDFDDEDDVLPVYLDEEDLEDDEEDEDDDDLEEDIELEDDLDSLIDDDLVERYIETDDFNEDKYNDLMDDYEDMYEE